MTAHYNRDEIASAAMTIADAMIGSQRCGDNTARPNHAVNRPRALDNRTETDNRDLRRIILADLPVGEGVVDGEVREGDSKGRHTTTTRELHLLVDGGVRDGGDVVRALALGASAVLIGRPYLWGLAAGGEDGVRRVLHAFVDDTVRALTLIGAAGAGERHHRRAGARSRTGGDLHHRSAQQRFDLQLPGLGHAQ